MFSLLFGLTFAVIALGGAITTIEMTMTKEKKRWMEKLKHPFSLEAAGLTIKSEPGKKPIFTYADEFGAYTLAQQGHLWYITCRWKGANSPYLKYMYNPSNGAITHVKLYKDEVPLPISTKELKEAIHWMQTGIHKEVHRHHQSNKNPNFSSKYPYEYIAPEKKDRWDALLQEMKNGSYRIYENGERFTLTLSQTQFIMVEENEEKETFEYGKAYQGNTFAIYRISRNKSTHEIYEYYMEDELLHKVDNVHEFALKQEKIWNEVRKISQKHNEKHKDLQSFFSRTYEEKEVHSSPHSRHIKPQDIQSYVRYFQKNLDYMADEDVWYVTQILPKRLNEIQRFIQRHPEAAGNFQKGLEQGLIKRLDDIYSRLQGNIEKEKIRLKKVVEIDA